MLAAVMLWYLIQQGTEYSLVESEKYPDLKVPDGQRRKKVRATYPDRKTAEEKGKAFAEQYHGSWKA